MLWLLVDAIQNGTIWQPAYLRLSGAKFFAASTRGIERSKLSPIPALVAELHCKVTLHGLAEDF